MWVHTVDHPALVLGSTQDPGIVDGALAASWGIEVVQRRSGGGVVLLVPGEVAWLDVILPAGDILWSDDVSRAGLWLGEVWQAALADLGIDGATVHRDAVVCGPLGRMVCFGVVGPGEVSVEGRKVVGVSQRRSRTAARFQCAAYRHWEADGLAALLRLDASANADLQAAASGTNATPGDIAAAFLRNLP